MSLRIETPESRILDEQREPNELQALLMRMLGVTLEELVAEAELELEAMR